MIIAYDLGTGGIKASLFSESGESLAFKFSSYETFASGSLIREQRPRDWIEALKIATASLLSESGVSAEKIQIVSISGHSLGVVPIGREGELLRERTPIWSDMRAESQAEKFFSKVDYKDWYMRTGCGFPPSCYPIFKAMWYAENEPGMFSKTSRLLGTKDYCNFFLTGNVCTDNSYASGSGAYDLKKGNYDSDFLKLAGLKENIFPEICPSHAVVGKITSEAASETGLREGTLVACGGVDNSCMALGSMGTSEGRVYTSVGSSAWVALSSSEPVLDFARKPYVFAHVADGMFVSSTCIFSAGTSLGWLKNLIAPDLGYSEFDGLAARSPVGSRGVIFNPSLAGGSMIEKSPNISGALFGLKLSSGREDIARAGLEGIALNLRYALDALGRCYPLKISEMPIFGGGGKSALWREIFAGVFGMKIVKSSVDQDAASLGAAALAMRAVGSLSDYGELDSLHKIQAESLPENVAEYEKIYREFLRRAALL